MTDHELLSRADRDPAAFTVFYRRHERAVVAFVGAVSEATVSAVERVVLESEEAVVEAWLSDLPADQREAVRRRVLDEADYPTIASELECSEAVVRQRVSRGLAALRKGLQ